jgi:hypothetical protein
VNTPAPPGGHPSTSVSSGGHVSAPASPGGGVPGLADRQAGLVAALTSGAPVPPGFDPRLVDVARVALLRKRAGEVARQWPALAAAHGREWPRVFARWAAARPTRGSLRDGWDLARDLGDRLPAAAAEEVAVREAAWFYDGRAAPRSRRMPAVRRAGGCVALQIAGRVRIVRRPG